MKKRNENTNNENAFIIEFIQLGNYVKATAIDPISGKEAAVMGPTNVSQKDLGNLAVKKLILALKKN